MSKAISIIIPVFNQIAYTKECLQALFAEESSQDFEVIVVDNGSTDETQNFLSNQIKIHSNLRVLRFESNQGFSIPCNKGAEIAEGNELVFLNNDTIPEKDWLLTLSRTLQLPKVGLVGPKLLYPSSRTVNHAGYVYNESLKSFYHIYQHYPEDFLGVNRRREFQALLGACVMLPKELFRSVGGFSLFGLEDIDLCLKVRAKGHTIVFEPRSVVLHHGSITLHNSMPDSLPSTDLLGFAAVWGKDNLISDDEKYYREDGLSLEEFRDGIFYLRETVGESEKLRTQATIALKNGDSIQAQSLLENSIDAYPGNNQAFEELISIHLAKGEIQKSLKLFEDMCTHVRDFHTAKYLSAKLAKQNGFMELYGKLTEELLADWTLPPDIRQQLA